MKLNAILSRVIETIIVLTLVCLVNIQPVLAAYSYMGKILNSVRTLIF